MTKEPSLLFLLGIALVCFKLLGWIDWSWWWVTLPFWLSAAIVLIVGLIVLVVTLVILIVDRRGRR